METNGIYKGGGQTKKQEVVTIITEINIETDAKNELMIKTYPALDILFDKGMYIERFNQTYINNGKYIITFIFRHYNSA
jgi:hypothetical protein